MLTAKNSQAIPGIARPWYFPGISQPFPWNRPVDFPGGVQLLVSGRWILHTPHVETYLPPSPETWAHRRKKRPKNKRLACASSYERSTGHRYKRSDALLSSSYAGLTNYEEQEVGSETRLRTPNSCKPTDFRSLSSSSPPASISEVKRHEKARSLGMSGPPGPPVGI